MHFGLVVTKSILIGTSIILSESENQINLTVENHIKGSLSKRLKEAT